MMDAALQARLAQNWQSVRSDVRDAAIAAGRDPSSVTIIGVTKYVDADVTAGLVAAGCRQLGENRPQVLWQKAESGLIKSTPDSSVQWHVIGHLQRNKLRRTMRHRPIIHSVDSMRLLTAIADEANEAGFTAEVLLEVNISDENAKTGMSADDLRAAIGSLPSSGVNVVGIMAMAAWGSDSSVSQTQFARTRMLRDELQTEFDIGLPHLSMGMSGDFREAIAEGATLVRIGSRLYDGVVDLGKARR